MIRYVRVYGYLNSSANRFLELHYALQFCDAIYAYNNSEIWYRNTDILFLSMYLNILQLNEYKITLDRHIIEFCFDCMSNKIHRCISSICALDSCFISVINFGKLYNILVQLKHEYLSNLLHEENCK